jgi:hypothetical protein
MDVHPLVQFEWRANITGALGWDWYWRQSTQDGIYAFGSDLLVDPAGTNHARYLGTHGDIEIRWAPRSTRHHGVQRRRVQARPVFR